MNKKERILGVILIVIGALFIILPPKGLGYQYWGDNYGYIMWFGAVMIFAGYIFTVGGNDGTLQKTHDRILQPPRNVSTKRRV